MHSPPSYRIINQLIMGKILQLPPHLVARIAAGEVIERPSFAVKELIENAIDAGADEISVVIENAGLKKIQVADTGEGMDSIDLQESIKPHTTSKIINENLIGIKTLGFRGEALASLAAVSTLTIKSRQAANLTGTEVVAKDGRILHVLPTGCPVGTIVIAENLFSHIPARKKFLKTPQTEFRHISDVVMRFAISFPTIQFTLVHNNKTVFSFPKSEKIEHRIKHLVGEDIFSLCIPIQTVDSHISLNGFVVKPQMHAFSHSKQFLFINNRQVSDKLISLAVKESYGTMLEPTTYPIFVLFITLPPEMVDVNVHPRKEQIQFFNNTLVFSFVKTAITQTLQENNITFQNLSWKRSGVGTTNSYAAKLLKETVLNKEGLFLTNNKKLLQIFNLYIISQNEQGLLIFDQHAAHERSLFEKLLKEFKKQRKTQAMYALKNKLVLNFSNSDQIIISEHKKLFKKIGFTFSGKTNNILTHVPLLLKDRNPQEIIKNIIHYLEQDIPIPSIDTISIDMLAFLACRSAVKAGDTLEEKQMRKIIESLEKTPNNATCPHGRPTRVFYSLEEINKNFKR